MYLKVKLVTILAIISTIRADQTYPGTEKRPILSESEVEKYTQNNYLSGWTPEEIQIPDKPDYVVKKDESIQAAVNEAIKNGNSTTRVYIEIEPGMYMETVYIAGNIPITLYGGGDTGNDVHIMATLSAQTSVSDYKNIVNPTGQRFQEGDPAWALYNSCASQDQTIGTFCTPVIWIASDNFQLYQVTVHNGASDAQAVAVRTEADKIHLMNNNFLGVQDTLGLGLTITDNKVVQRVMVHMCYVEGEIDYVFGGASAVFKMVTFNTTFTKKTEEFIVFAPDTLPSSSFGFLVVGSVITGDQSSENASKVKLARSWDKGVRSADDYVPGKSPNGQLVVRDSQIDAIIDVDSPYTAAATSKRPFSSDIKPNRDLDDNKHNRLWEFNNTGDGA